jgi:cytochrome c553
MKLRQLCAAALALMSALVSSTATAGTAELGARSLAATCAQCHGTDGSAIEGSMVPGLAGMPAGDLAERMKSFKSGARPGSVMPQIAKGYTDAQIEQLAAYFAARKKTGP